jgi:hypothetical protein
LFTSLKMLFAAVAGLALGLGLTRESVDRGVAFATSRIGPWVAANGAGTENEDPYERADLARRAEIPLGLGEGLSFVASVDSSGAPLDGRCDYFVSRSTPPARYWSLSVMTPQGALLDNAAHRYGFTSAELVRASDGDFTIEADRSARPGNWLPLGARLSSFVFVLRLYDTPVTATLRNLAAADMPAITRKGCA